MLRRRKRVTRARDLRLPSSARSLIAEPGSDQAKAEQERIAASETADEKAALVREKRKAPSNFVQGLSATSATRCTRSLKPTDTKQGAHRIVGHCRRSRQILSPGVKNPLPAHYPFEAARGVRINPPSDDSETAIL